MMLEQPADPVMVAGLFVGGGGEDERAAQAVAWFLVSSAPRPQT